jgi:hypothetical protein
VFTKAHHWCYSEPDESSTRSNRFTSRSLLILSSHLRLGLPSGLFSFELTLCAHLIAHVRAACSAHLIKITQAILKQI